LRLIDDCPGHFHWQLLSWNMYGGNRHLGGITLKSSAALLDPDVLIPCCT